MDIFLNPDKFLQRSFTWKEPIIVLFLATVVAVYSASILAPYIAESTRELLLGEGLDASTVEGIVRLTYLMSIVGAAAGIFINWIIYSALIYFAAYLLKGKGSFTNLMKLIAFSFVPTLVLSPFSIFLVYDTAEMISKFGLQALSSINVSQVILSLATYAWSYMYLLFAAKNGLNLDIKKAAISAAAPLILIAIFSVIGFASAYLGSIL